MPAASKAQQQLMGMAYALKKGEMDTKDASQEVKDLADSMTLKKLKDFASTKHEGLPDKVEENITLNSIGGMGDVTLPTETEDGSGDVPAGSGDAKKRYKKKMKSFKTFEQFVNENMNLDPIAANFLDIIKVANNKIELKDVTVEATPKGNWQVYWKGKSLMKVNGKILNDATVMKYNLEHR